MTSRLDQSIAVSTTALTVQNTNESGKQDIDYSTKQVLPQQYVAPLELMTTNSTKTGAPYNKKIRFTVTKDGSLMTVLVRVDMELTTLAAVGLKVYGDHWTGLDMIDALSGKIGTTQISNIYGNAMRRKIQNMNTNEKIACLEQLAPRNSNTHEVVSLVTTAGPLAPQNIYFCIPIILFFNDKNQLLQTYRLLLKKLQDVELSLSFKGSHTDMGFNPLTIDSGGISLTDVELYANKLRYNTYTENMITKMIDGNTQKTMEELKMIESNPDMDNSAKTKDMIIGYTYDSFNKSCVASATQTITFKITKYILQSKFYVNLPTFLDIAPTINKILSFTLKLNGSKLIDNLPRRMLNHHEHYANDSSLITLNRSTSTLTLGYEDNSPVVITWSAIPEIQNLFSGGVSLEQIPEIEATIVCAGALTTDYEFIVDHKTLQFTNLGEAGTATVTSMS